MPRRPLSDEDIATALVELPAWTHDHDRLVRRVRFLNAREAVSYLVRVAFEAERLDHHPDLRWIHDRVELALNTHDADHRVTERDLALARAIDAIDWPPPR